MHVHNKTATLKITDVLCSCTTNEVAVTMRQMAHKQIHRHAHLYRHVGWSLILMTAHAMTARAYRMTVAEYVQRQHCSYLRNAWDTITLMVSDYSNVVGARASLQREILWETLHFEETGKVVNGLHQNRLNGCGITGWQMRPSEIIIIAAVQWYRARRQILSLSIRELVANCSK